MPRPLVQYELTHLSTRTYVGTYFILISILEYRYRCAQGFPDYSPSAGVSQHAGRSIRDDNSKGKGCDPPNLNKLTVINLALFLALLYHILMWYNKIVLFSTSLTTTSMPNVIKVPVYPLHPP